MCVNSLRRTKMIVRDRHGLLLLRFWCRQAFSGAIMTDSLIS